MLSYEVIVNGYFGMPMDPLDPNAQLVMEAPLSLDYIPGPEAPPSSDYIPGPEVPPSPDYIPGLKYPEYLLSADDVLPAEEQPLPAAISPTSESPGYITDSELEMDPEEEDRDDEKSKGDSFEYPTSRGDGDADDDGDDFLEDDADDEDEEESSNSEDEEEEHLALTVLAPALHKSEVERLLAIPTPPLSLVLPTSYPLPPFLMPLPIFTPLPPPPPIILPRTRASMALMRSAAPFTFILAPRSRTPPIGTPSLLPIPLPTTSFPLPLLLPFTSGSESIPKADMPLQKSARFTTLIGGYEVGKSFVAAARQIRPALTVDDSCRAKDRLIGRMRRENHGLLPVTRGVVAAMAEAEASRVRNGYGSNGLGPRLAQAVRECTYPDFLKCQPLNFKGTEGVVGLTQWFEKIECVFNISKCTAACQVKYAACTLQRVALTWWNSHVKTVTLEVAQALPWKTLKKMMTDKYCPRGKIKKLKTGIWELNTKVTDVIGYSRHFQELALMYDRTFLEESDRVEKYIGGLPDTIHDSVKATRPKTMQEAIEFSTELMDKRIRDAVENKQKFEGTSRNNQNQPQQNKRQNTSRSYVAGNSDRNMYTGSKPLCSKCDYRYEGPCPPRRETGGNDNAQERVYVVGNARANPDNIVAVMFLLKNRYAYILFDTGADRIFVSTTFSSQIDIAPIALDHHYNVFNIDLLPVELGSFDVIVGMD
nr:hypothetical protein [Tanacetum cinerariifolium]